MKIQLFLFSCRNMAFLTRKNNQTATLKARLCSLYILKSFCSSIALALLLPNTSTSGQCRVKFSLKPPRQFQDVFTLQPFDPL